LFNAERVWRPASGTFMNGFYGGSEFRVIYDVPDTFRITSWGGDFAHAAKALLQFRKPSGASGRSVVMTANETSLIEAIPAFVAKLQTRDSPSSSDGMYLRGWYNPFTAYTLVPIHDTITKVVNVFSRAVVSGKVNKMVDFIAWASYSGSADSTYAYVAPFANQRNFFNGTTKFGGLADNTNGVFRPTDNSAIVDIESTTMGFLPPRMTTVNMNAIGTPAAGLQIHNTTDAVPYYYDGSVWKSFANLSRFGLEDNMFSSRRAVNMQDLGLNLDSGKVIIRSSQLTATDTALMVLQGLNPLFSISTVDGFTRASLLDVSNGKFMVNGSGAFVNGIRLFMQGTDDNNYIGGYQHPVIIKRAFPGTGGLVGLIVNNDTAAAASVDSAAYNIQEWKWTQYADNSTRTKAYLTGRGYMWFAEMPFEATPDTLVAWKNGILTATLRSSIGGGAAWSAITNPTTTQSLTFDDGETSAWANGSNTETFLDVTSNSLTTGTVFNLTTSSITSGTLLSLSSTSTALAVNNEMLNIASSGANGTSSITATGMRVAVTNTGTSSVNYGAIFSASGATTNYDASFEGGRVSFGGATVAAGATDATGAVQGSFFRMTDNAWGGLTFFTNANYTTKTTFGSQGIQTNQDFLLVAVDGDIRFNATRIMAGTNTNATSTLQSNGSFAAAITSTSIDLTLSISHSTVKVDATGAARIITLPAASACTGRIYYVLKSDATVNTVTIDGNGSETISGAANQVLSTQWSGFAMQSDGSNFVIIGTF
jgi:hypothetical protein